VFGIEAQTKLGGSQRNAGCPSTLGGVTLTTNCNAKVDALGTIAGRLGVAFDRVLVTQGRRSLGQRQIRAELRRS
jgi:hypothetical protein